MHFNPDDAVALAGLAPPALSVKAETSRLVAAHFGLLRLCKQVANQLKRARVSSSVRARCAPNGRLVNLNDLVDVLKSQEFPMRPRPSFGPAYLLR